MAINRFAGVLLALSMSSMTACTATPAATPTPTASVSVTPTPSATTPTLTPTQVDLENAKQAVVKLWAVVDRLTNDPKSSIQDLDSVATDATLTMFQQNLVKYRSAGWKGSGSSVVEDLTATARGVNAEGRSTWTVTACIDGSKTTLVDASGKSVQGPPYRVRHESKVVQRSTGFFVADDEAVGTC